VITSISYKHIQDSPESFIQGLFAKSIENPTRETIKSWCLVNELEKINLFNNIESLDNVPYLTKDFLKIDHKNGVLVKFHCMVQNISENQLYLSYFHDKNLNKNAVNKYHEYDFKSIQKNEVDENLMDEDSNIENKTLLERLVLNCVPIPGTNKDDPDMKVFVYEYDNEHVKINEERLFVGVAYVIMGKIEVHSWFNILDFSKLFYPKIPVEGLSIYDIYRHSNNVKIENIDNLLNKFYLTQKEKLKLNFKETRNKLKLVLSEIFGGDELLAEYILLYLTSRVFSRYSTIVTGKFCLNISRVNLEKDLQTLDINPSKNFNLTTLESCVRKLFEAICGRFIYFPFTVKNMNEKTFKSFFDVTKDELRQGLLQVVDSTYFVVDERVMETGQLNENGLNNLQALVNLIEGQFMHYEYPYNNVEINQDVKIMLITQTKPIISKNTTAITEVPLVKTQPFNFAVLDNLKEEDIENFRKFVFLVQHPYLKFVIETEISEKIQKDFLSERSKNPEYSPDNLDRNLNLSKLYAISNGETVMLYEDYCKIKELETYRQKKSD
jgi:hypothetical protein